MTNGSFAPDAPRGRVAATSPNLKRAAGRPTVACFGFGEMTPRVHAWLQAARLFMVASLRLAASLDVALERGAPPDVIVLGWHCDLADFYKLVQCHQKPAFVVVLRAARPTVETAWQLAGASAVLSSRVKPDLLVATVLAVSAGLRFAPPAGR